MKRASLVVMGLCLAAPGCGSSSNVGPDADVDADSDIFDGLVSLELTPNVLTVVADGDQPATAQFTATGHFSDGSSRDLTTAASWRVDDPTLGRVTDGLFTSFAFGGAANVSASAGSVSARTTITVVLRRREQVTDGVGGGVSDPPAPPGNAPDLFGGPASTDDNRRPQLVYPGSGVLLPPNLGKLEVHFLPGASNTVFELAFHNAYTDIKLYLRCGPLFGPTSKKGCIYLPSPAVWSWLAKTNRGRGPLELAIRATDDQGSQVATGETINLEFSQDDLRGAVYYWSTRNKAILRWDFASTTQTEAEVYFGAGKGTDKCVGCHAISPDGKRMTVQQDGQNSGIQFLLDVAKPNTPLVYPTPAKAVFTSWDPEGTHYVAVYDEGDSDPARGDAGPYAKTTDDDQLLIIDGTTGQQTSVIQVGGTNANPVNHPDWSPTGDKIAFVSVGNDTRSLQKFHNGRVGFVEKVGETWSAPIWMTPQGPGINRYFPAFAPDGAFLVYNESNCPAGKNEDVLCNGDSDPSARLLFVTAKEGATPVAGDNANRPGIMDGASTNLTNSFPKWSPFEFQRSGELGSRLMWLTFSSSRSYGLRGEPPQGTTSEGPTGTYIWMVAVNPGAVAAGRDPTFVPFVLPFQDIKNSNHIAQWTKKAPPRID